MYRERFHIPRSPGGGEAVYLSGHSLGLQPKSVRAYVDQELAEWEKLGVDGHFHARHPWMSYHKLLTNQTAKLVGALPLEVVVMNSLTVNLHLMMVSFYRPTRERHRILIEAGAFPSDQYAVQSQLKFHGYDPAGALIEVQDEPIEAAIQREGESIALVLAGGVNYASGEVFDMQAITRAGHQQGCIVAFDLAHAAGNIPLSLHDWDVDFAAWCSYKYLNGGPGCIAGCFVHERHARAWDLPRFAGWWGHHEATRFRMGPDFQPIPGAEGWQLSNPPVLSLAALRASMDIFEEAGVDRLRARSKELTGALQALLDECASERFSVITPREPHRRGAQLSIRIRENGRALLDALSSRGIVCDWREPDILRVAPVPLYNTLEDVERFVERFREAVRRV
jgi:kynureninase